jgi:hypothetical protein
MAELGEGLSGYLDVQDATLRAPRLEAVSNIGIANTAPQHAFSVGSNLYVDTESSNVLTVDGNVVCEGVKVGLIEIVPSYDLAAVSNVGNVTQSTIQFANTTTSFVTTANAISEIFSRSRGMRVSTETFPSHQTWRYGEPLCGHHKLEGRCGDLDPHRVPRCGGEHEPPTGVEYSFD